MEHNDYWVEIYTTNIGWERVTGTFRLVANHLVEWIVERAIDLDEPDLRSYARKQVKDSFIRSMDHRVCKNGVSHLYIGGVLARVSVG